MNHLRRADTQRWPMQRALAAATACCALGIAVTYAGPRGHVELYAGFGTTERVIVRGRALEDAPPEPPAERGSRLLNFVRTVRLLETDELKRIPVRAWCADRSARAETDEEGMFELWIDAGEKPFEVGELPVRVEVERPGEGLLTAEGQALVYPEDLQRLIICDFDDTLCRTGMGSPVRAGMKTLFDDPSRMKCVEGMPELLRRLTQPRGEDRPSAAVFYLSGSPVNLHPRISAFLSSRGFPKGQLLLRNLGFGPGDDAWSLQRYKRQQVESLMSLFRAPGVVLIGDSTEKDPEVYSAVRSRHSERVEAVFVHQVGDLKPAEEERFVDVHLFKDGHEALRQAQAAGLVDEVVPAQSPLERNR